MPFAPVSIITAYEIYEGHKNGPNVRYFFAVMDKRHM